MGVILAKEHVKKHPSHSEDVKSFVEESFIRRELADNFCYYKRDSYDALDSCYQWARDTLRIHTSDKREHIYSYDEMDFALTNEELWNAAQRQLVSTGKMASYLRMLWAKLILTWTETPEEALRRSFAFNDRYAFDGCSPNGYVGVMWCIGGVHDSFRLQAQIRRQGILRKVSKRLYQSRSASSR